MDKTKFLKDVENVIDLLYDLGNEEGITNEQFKLIAESKRNLDKLIELLNK